MSTSTFRFGVEFSVLLLDLDKINSMWALFSDLHLLTWEVNVHNRPIEMTASEKRTEA